jgi:hypothetical protein
VVADVVAQILQHVLQSSAFDDALNHTAAANPPFFSQLAPPSPAPADKSGAEPAHWPSLIESLLEETLAELTAAPEMVLFD